MPNHLHVARLVVPAAIRRQKQRHEQQRFAYSLYIHRFVDQLLCHTHRTTPHKYMTYARMLSATMACISREKQWESKASVAAMD
jgi:hypothetical protein